MKRWIAVRTTAVWLALVLVLMGVAAQAQSVQVTVNGTQITDQQINARAQLIRLERRGTSNANRTQLATEELINDAIKLSEAERVGIAVSDAQVDERLRIIASGMNLSVSNLTNVLTQNGVNPSSLRARLRAAIAWQGVVRQVVSPRVQISELELDIQAEQQLEATSSFDYILKEVIFVIANGSGMSASRRTAEANQYRSRFSGCDAAVDLVLEFQDAAVIDIGRRHATQMPDAVANELAGLTVGQLTRPRVVENGVSMYAVCEKAEARDLTFIKQDLRREVGRDALEEQAEAYLARLREQAVIVRQ